MIRFVRTVVWRKNAAAATRSKTALAPPPQYSDFRTDGRHVFRSIVAAGDRVTVTADVEYALLQSGAQRPGSLGSIISAARLELALGRRFGWAPLRIPLPIRSRDSRRGSPSVAGRARLTSRGWLDVTHLSENMRVTRGPRGGIFVHLRPTMLTREAPAAAT